MSRTMTMTVKRTFAFALAALMMLLMLAGCSGQAAQSGDASANTIKIGILGPHTGEYAAYGLGVRNGAELYFNKVNENGGINGKRIELVIYDNKGNLRCKGNQTIRDEILLEQLDWYVEGVEFL